MIYLIGVSDVHIFGLENPNASEFFGAANVPDPDAGKHFTDPTYSVLLPSANVEWIDGNLKAPVLGVIDTRTFSYKSYFAPMVIPVYAYVIDGGDSAEGETLGMGATVPEPSSLAALLFGAVGLVPLVMRRRK